MTQLGIDYASVDGDAPPDHHLVADSVSFAYIRRSYCFHDPAHQAYRLAHDATYARDAAGLRAADVVVGAYLFPVFDQGSPSPAEQFANFEASPGEMLVGDLPPVLDVEFPSGLAKTGRSKAEVFKDILAYIQMFQTRYGAVSIYTSYGEWHDELGGPDNDALRSVSLWLKTAYRLKAGQPVDHVMPRVPHAGPSAKDPYGYWQIPTPWLDYGPWIQQFQGDSLGFAGFSRTVDVDRFLPLAGNRQDVGRIELVQARIGAPQTGVMDNDTIVALKQAQSDAKLVSDGIIGVRSFAALLGVQR